MTVHNLFVSMFKPILIHFKDMSALANSTHEDCQGCFFGHITEIIL